MQGQRRRCQRVLNQAGRTPDDRQNQGERSRDRGRYDSAGEETPATLSVSTTVYEHTEVEVQITSSKLVSK